MRRRALHVFISSLLLFAIVISMVLATYLWGKPQVEKSRDVATIEAMKSNFDLIDSAIRSVAREGESSYRSVDLHISKGRVTVNGSNELLEYKIESMAKVVEPNVTVKEGDIYVEGTKSPRGEYITHLYLNYSPLAIDINGSSSAGKGYYTLIFKNSGYNQSAERIEMEAYIK